MDSTLVFENSDHMMELPIINYDQKQVCDQHTRVCNYNREFFSGKFRVLSHLTFYLADLSHGGITPWLPPELNISEQSNYLLPCTLLGYCGFSGNCVWAASNVIPRHCA